MIESGFWNSVRTGLTKLPGTCDLVRVENTAQEGTPDVNYCLDGCEGWMELKHVKEWPKRRTTAIRLDHYTQQQKDWLKRRGKAGGRAWLLVRVDKTVILFDWQVAQVVGTMTAQQMKQYSTVHWTGRDTNWPLLKEHLCSTE